MMHGKISCGGQMEAWCLCAGILCVWVIFLVITILCNTQVGIYLQGQIQEAQRTAVEVVLVALSYTSSSFFMR